MFGKVIGAVSGAGLGLLTGNVPVAIALALAGLVVGHLLLDAGGARVAPKPAPPARPPPRAAVPPPADTALVDALAPLFIEIARADGDVTQDEVHVAREFFAELPEAREPLRLALKAALAATVQPLEPLVLRARPLLPPPQRLRFVYALYDLALVDGPLTRAEQDALRRVVQHLNLSDEQLQAITAKHLGSGDPHYRALALAPSASDDEIRAAWKRLALENHPDRYSTHPKAEADAARARFEAAKDAYEALKKLRGL